MTAPRSNADRYGQLAAVLIVCGLLAWLGWWAIGLIPAADVRSSVLVVAIACWALILGTGIHSALAKIRGRSDDEG